MATGFDAEFLAAVKCGPPRQTGVEIVRMPHSVAVARGTVGQQGTALLNYNAVALLKDRKSYS